MYTPNMMSVLEEAENHLVCHVCDLVQNGFSKISVKTCYSNVVVILLGFMMQFIETMQQLMLVVEFTANSNKRTISINSSYTKLGDRLCLALPFFHCFTGADSTISSFKKG